MFSLFGRKPRAKKSTVQLSVIELCEDGYCAVVGESFYQDALRATRQASSVGHEGRHEFTAVLVREPDNPYDRNAIAVYSTEGKIGHLSREAALAYADLFSEVARRGYHGGACTAYLTGGEPDKPSFGVVLRLADPDTCAADLFEAEDDDSG